MSTRCSARSNSFSWESSQGIMMTTLIIIFCSQNYIGILSLLPTYHQTYPDQQQINVIWTPSLNRYPHIFIWVEIMQKFNLADFCWLLSLFMPCFVLQVRSGWVRVKKEPFLRIIIIQIMSKKPQPQKAENNKNKIEIVDQQNEPFLRALQKKVRNINKKLTEITELEAKENLKPEQVEKINRRDALIQERIRIEENATFFKQVYAENVAHYRNNQLRELEVLARAISIYHTAPQIPENARLSALWRSLEQHESHPNLNAAINSLATALKDFANDRKLQKALTNHTQKHGNEEIKQVEINQEKIVNDIVSETPEVQEVKVQVPEVKAELVPPQETQTPVVVEVVVAEVQQVQPVAEKAPEVPQVIVEQQATPIIQEPAATPVQAQQPVEQKRQGERRHFNNRDNRDRPYRGKGNPRGNNRERREGDGQRQQYKPKYQERKDERQAEDNDSSESDEQVRQFRRDEIKRLEDDGFIVVGKPKPKPKDPQEQRRNHQKQHGRKPQPNNEAVTN